MAGVELYGATTCPYTSELRDHLRWRRIRFTEYDVDGDLAARARLRELTGDRISVPVLVEDGLVKQVGWRGRSCFISSE